MIRYKAALSIVISILISLAAIPTVGEGSVESLTISIDTSGAVYVEFYADLKPSINTFKLSIDPIAETINIKCDSEVLPWILTDRVLNIVSNNECRALIEYLAKIYVNGTILSFDIKDNVMAKLVAERNIVLLGIPEDIELFSMENGRLVIVFRGPANITYTLSAIANATTAITPPAEKIQPFPMLALIGIAIAVAIVITTLVFILRRR